MKRILCISGSRADYGLLEWPVKVLREAFWVELVEMKAGDPSSAFSSAKSYLDHFDPDCLLILGDRWEILQAAIAAHLQRVPIAHIGGGDVTEGSYDDAMRDCISRLAKWHFVTSWESYWKVHDLRTEGNVRMVVGNIALDYIMHGDWKRERPYAKPYVVVSYQPETVDGKNEFPDLMESLPSDGLIDIILPNADVGSEEIAEQADVYARSMFGVTLHESLPHAEFLNLIYHCEEFIGNSSAMLYEAPALGVKCRMIGKRQQGRVAPTGDGKASERIKEVLCRELS